MAALGDALWSQFHSFLGPECSDLVLKGGDYFNSYCAHLVFSKLLSVLLIVGGLLVKLPQIMRIMRTKSVEGISLLGLFLETCSLYLSVAYNIRKRVPFIAFGELAFLLFQDVDILILALVIRRLDRLFFAYVFVQVLMQVDLFRENILSDGMLRVLQYGNAPLMLASKILQLTGMIRAGRKGQLSLVSSGMQFCGSVARIYAARRGGVDDKIISAGFQTSSLLNGLTFTLGLCYCLGIQNKSRPQRFGGSKSRTRRRI